MTNGMTDETWKVLEQKRNLPDGGYPVRLEFNSLFDYAKSLREQLAEALKYGARENGIAYLEKLEPCEHNEYWVTVSGGCMACRATKAEALVAQQAATIADRDERLAAMGSIQSKGRLHREEYAATIASLEAELKIKTQQCTDNWDEYQAAMRLLAKSEAELAKFRGACEKCGGKIKVCASCWSILPAASESPKPKDIQVGDIVVAKRPSVLCCGSGIYPDAVVMSRTPLILTSREADMVWTEFEGVLETVGRASSEEITAGARRLDKDKASAVGASRSEDLSPASSDVKKPPAGISNGPSGEHGDRPAPAPAAPKQDGPLPCKKCGEQPMWDGQVMTHNPRFWCKTCDLGKGMFPLEEWNRLNAPDAKAKTGRCDHEWVSDGLHAATKRCKKCNVVEDAAQSESVAISQDTKQYAETEKCTCSPDGTWCPLHNPMPTKTVAHPAASAGYVDRLTKEQRAWCNRNRKSVINCKDCQGGEFVALLDQAAPPPPATKPARTAYIVAEELVEAIEKSSRGEVSNVRELIAELKVLFKEPRDGK